MIGSLYMRSELMRLLRNRRFFLFSLGFPLVLYFLIATPNRHEHNLGGSGISAPLYLMVGLVAFGTMNSVMGAGARIAAERVLGWNRQLRLTPLPARVYFTAKIVTAYVTAGITIAVLFLSGLTLGVRLSALTWLEMTGLLLVGLIPFAALGIVIGHLVRSDSIGPALGGLTALFGLLGGVWFPIGNGGVLHAIATALPSYWLVQASRLGAGGHGWPVSGWIVIALWTSAGVGLARWAYRRDTQRD
jgi:ABC-2 type transport system permease protein